MNSAEKSLRFLVDKWLAPTPTTRLRVIQFGRIGRIGCERRRYVRVEALAPSGSRAIFFFRHDDGFWCVFPPSIARPALTDHQLAA
ncbi:hypothetical protein [Paraburkholderia sp. GAS334]|jgi:hypothetical protein|uniref:hypothetical protein n=1 Tax=unclassified Paraburkholderia TaxID=2615204 RepID=UPI003D1BB47B